MWSERRPGREIVVVGSEQAAKVLAKRAAYLRKMWQKFGDGDESGLRRAVNVVASKIGLGEVLDPIAHARDEMRDGIIEMYSAMRVLVADGKERVEMHNKLKELLESVEAGESEKVTELRAFLMRFAEGELRMGNDSEVEQILSSVLEESKGKLDEKRKELVVKHAKLILGMSEPMVSLMKIVLTSAVLEMDAAKFRLAALVTVGAGYRKLRRAADSIVGADQAGEESMATMIKAANLTVEQAELALMVAERGLLVGRDERGVDELRTRVSSLILRQERVLDGEARLIAPEERK